MKSMQKLWPLSLVALWGATSSFINLGVSSDAIEAPTSTQAPASTSAAPQDTAKCERGTAFITVDGLLWKAQESGLSYATKTANTGNTLVGKGKVKDLEFKWDYGFRTGLGFNIPHGNYDTCFNYTWFRDTAKGNTNNNGNMRVFPTLINASLDLVAAGGLTPGTYALSEPTTATADAHWKLHLNVLDWELGKQFVPYQWFSFRPFLGVKAAWVHQNYDIQYDSLNLTTSPNFDYSVQLKNNYWGVGPTGGFTSQFWLGNGFSIFGKAAVSLVYGSFTLTHEEQATIISTGTTTTIANLSDHYGAGRAITDLAIGLGWDTKFCKDRFHLALAAGWEQHIYFGQGEFMHFMDPSNGGHFTQDHSDLSLQGGTLSAKFQF